MELQEKHKEFVVQGYARFMKRNEIVEAFMEEFKYDISQLCTTKLPSQKEDYDEIDEYRDEYLEKHGIPITEVQIDEYTEAIEDAMPDAFFASIRDDLRTKRDTVKKKLSARFRRLNITHAQFPNKYRELFNRTREEYLANYRLANLSIPENVVLELETLYGLTKELAFETRDSKYIVQAAQILKTIAACNALNQQGATQAIAPGDINALEDTSKAIAVQFKKETRQLEKHTENRDA